MIDPAKQYTQNGRPARVLAMDIKGDEPIAIAVDHGEHEVAFRCCEADLVEVKSAIERWVNIDPSCRKRKYITSETYQSKDEADANAKCDRIACVQITFTEGQGLEPVAEKEVEWEWPEWLVSKYIVMEPDGRWFGTSNDESITYEIGWGGLGNYFFINPEHVDFTPPPCTDWRQSKRKNPRCK